MKLGAVSGCEAPWGLAESSQRQESGWALWSRSLGRPSPGFFVSSYGWDPLLPVPELSLSRIIMSTEHLTLLSSEQTSQAWARMPEASLLVFSRTFIVQALSWEGTLPQWRLAAGA